MNAYEEDVDMIKWNAVFQRLMRLMDTQGATYCSGPRFLGVMSEFYEDLPEYGELMEERRAAGKSTTRAHYFKELFMNLEEGARVRAVCAFLDEIETVEGMAGSASETRKLLGAAH